MKYLIASDIHGSALFCGKMLEFAEKMKADRIILLGDLLYHGPRNHLPDGYDPKAVIAQLNACKEKLICVRGNCDAEVDQMVLDFPIMADYMILPAGNRLIYATHGHTINMKSMIPMGKIDILLHGHTHIPAWEEFDDGKLYLNPGSTSLPKESSPHSCMTFDGHTFKWYNLDQEMYHELTI